jgi:hypothetical protein
MSRTGETDYFLDAETRAGLSPMLPTHHDAQGIARHVETGTTCGNLDNICNRGGEEHEQSKECVRTASARKKVVESLLQHS